MVQDYQEIRKNISQKKWAPVYFLEGDETYFIDELVSLLDSEVLSPSEKSFNLSTFYGKDTKIINVIDTAQRYPMMSEFQLIFLKEAQDCRELASLENYIKNPVKSTILCIAHKYKMYDKRSKFGKLVKASDDIVLFSSKKMYDNQIPDFVDTFITGNGYVSSPKVNEMLAENIGNNLTLITNELKKLFNNISKDKEISLDDVERYIGISKEYNVFELAEAFAKKDAQKVFKIANNFAANPKKYPTVVIIANLFGFFSKTIHYASLQSKSEFEAAKAIGLSPRNDRSAAFLLSRYKMGRKNYSFKELMNVIHLLKEYDLKSKGVGATNLDESALLSELFSKILLSKSISDEN